MIVRSMVVVGGNLFRIAAEQLGDPLQWVNIAQQNGLTDPFLEGTVKLYIPSASTAFADGLGTQ